MHRMEIRQMQLDKQKIMEGMLKYLGQAHGH